MTLWQSSRSDERMAEVHRWLPPDLTPRDQVSIAPKPTVPMPSDEEVAAIRWAAQEAGSKAGYEAGYLEGYQKGYEEGRVAAEQEALAEQCARDERERQLREEHEQRLAETVAALEGVARDLADPLASMVDSLEPELLALTGAVARRVVMAELATTPDLIREVLIRALSQLPSRNHAVRVRVHPREQEILVAHALACGESVAWLADPEIERGGCVVESGPSRIDATLDARLRQAIDAIWGELTQPISSEDPRGREVPDALPSDAVAAEPEVETPAARIPDDDPGSAADSSGHAMAVEPSTMAADIEHQDASPVADELAPEPLPEETT